jgi:hypothetical protein
MTAKEAWVYSRALCEAQGIESPTLRTFKWYLQHGSEIDSELVPDPFGNGEKVHSLTREAVEAFVLKLRERGASEPKSETETPVVQPETTPGPVPPQVVEQVTESKKARGSDRELDARQALDYVWRKVGKDCDLNHTTFGFYLAYDLIPSRFEGRQRVVRQADLDAFLDLAPDGVYANHLTYETEMNKGRGDLTMTEAYAYYAEVDPSPIALNSFRSLVAAGLLRPIRTANDPKAPVLGFKKQEIDSFLAMRQRMIESTREQPPTKSFLTRKAAETASPPTDSSPGQSTVARVMAEVLERSKLKIDPPTSEVAQVQRREAPAIPESRDLTQGPFEETSVVPEPPVAAVLRDALEESPARWVPVSEGYGYYVRAVEDPRSFSWFRLKAYRSELFTARLQTDSRSTNSTGKIYYVDLRSIDAYAASLRVPEVPRSKPKTEPKTDSPDRAKPLHMMGAYAYYCSRCSDPVAESRFAKWVMAGTFVGAEKTVEGLWTLTTERIDAFLAEHPTGRLQANRDSRKTKETPDAPTPRAPKAKPDEGIEAPRPGHITISLKNYPSATEMQKALRLLTEQGFDVEVVP